MKLVSFLQEERDRLGVLINDVVYDMEVLHPDLPNGMGMFLNYWEDAFPVAQAGELMLREGTRTSNKGIRLNDVQLLAPVPFPTSCRDGYGFRQHVATARKNRGVEMIAEFDQYPVFYFTNHHGVQGPGEIFCMPDHFEKLDFEQALGGHGDVMRGKEKFEMWKSYFRDLLDETGEAYSNGASLEQAQSQVSKALIAKYAAKFDPNFPQSVNANIAKAYQVIAMAR